jgi:hypothetical protein
VTDLQNDKVYLALMGEHATLDDVMPLLSRIADALDRLAPNPDAECGEDRDSVLCGLRTGHVGYHVSADGNLQWLDDMPTQVRGPEH